jgi:hypothetical protein
MHARAGAHIFPGYADRFWALAEREEPVGTLTEGR